MHPVIADLGWVRVGSHEFFVALGVLVAAVVVVLESRRRGTWGDGMLAAVAGGLVGGALGMHASALIRDPDALLQVPLGDLLQDGAKSVLGGLTGAYVGVLVGKRLVGYRERTGDAFAPAVAIGMAVGRIGCLLTEPPGRPTSLPWAVHLSAEQAAAIPGCTSCVPGAGLHPSFAYEIVFHLVAFGVLLAVRGRVTSPGALLTFYLAGYAVFRFAIEFTRDNEVVLLELTRGQLFLLTVGPVLLWRTAVLVRRERERSARGDGASSVVTVAVPGGSR
jgi:prolipoprotein diacylglyceryltransferase